jgi:hypothetical protein
MVKSINLMKKSGTSCFIDFRENGLNGINKINAALKDQDIRGIILSRPSELQYNRNEINQLLNESNGIGLSSISDWDYSEIEKIAKHVKRKRKTLSLHASEIQREDIDKILNLKPDFLVHMIKATKSDLQRAQEEEIPIVICPRAYSFFNLKYNLRLFKKIGLKIMLGTDNAMINSPNIIEEVKFLSKKSKIFSFEELINMVTYTPRKVLNLDDCISGPNLLNNFVVLEEDSLNPIYVSKNQV